MRSQRTPVAAVLFVMAVCWSTAPFTLAEVSMQMGNITFECPDGWTNAGPDCLMFVDDQANFDSAEDACESYGSKLVDIRDEDEAKSVGKMVQRHDPQWGNYWIGNEIEDVEDTCGGFWDVSQPPDMAQYNGLHVSANAPQGRWTITDKSTRLPFVCRTEACVQGTFRCKDGSGCISDNYVCDNAYDCNDMSDESNCAASDTKSYRQDSGTIAVTYQAGKTYSWFIEGTPGKILSLVITSLDVEVNVDYLEVWSGSPSLVSSHLQARLTGSVSNRRVYGTNNFLIVRLVGDLDNQGSGLNARWEIDDELSPRDRSVVVGASYVDLMSPYADSAMPPAVFDRYYSLSSDDGESLITLEVTENSLDDGFIFDKMSLGGLTDGDMVPAFYVSRPNMFSLHLSSQSMDEAKKFKARAKKGCAVELTATNGYVTSAQFGDEDMYPASTMCSYVIHAPKDAQRTFQLQFETFNLADGKDFVKVYAGSDNSAAILTPSAGYTGDNPATNASFVANSPTVFVEFQSSWARSDGFFKLLFNLECPAIFNTANMVLSSQATEYDSEVVLSCNTGFAFAQEELVEFPQITVRCGEGGMWNVSRLPTCQPIYCGVPQPINNGFILSGSASAGYNSTVTYQCFAGFTMADSSVSTCGGDSMWSAAPVCQASQCPPLANVTNGDYGLVTGTGTDFGVVVNYTCDPGYDLIGSRFSVCLNSGNWSHPAPTCQEILCPVPDVGSRATVSPSTPVSLGSPVQMQCDDGYVFNMSGLVIRTGNFVCLPSGGYTFSQYKEVCLDFDDCSAAQDPCVGPNEVCVNTEGSHLCVCRDKYRRPTPSSDCEVIDRCAEGTSGCDPVNGNCTATNGGEDYECSCNPGYVLFTTDGQSGRFIPPQEDGMKAGDVYRFNHTCVPVTCGAAPNITNGRALTKKSVFDFGDTVEYRCDFGYNMTSSINSDYTLQCEESGDMGVWDKSAPTCQSMECGALMAYGLVQNIYPNSTTMPGDTVRLECYSERDEQNYNKTLFCGYDKDQAVFRLMGDEPQCPRIDCGNLTAVGGANFSVTGGTLLGASFTFVCASGFVLDGNSTRGNTEVFCEKNGRWGLGNLTCIGERCTDPGTPGGMRQVAAVFEVGGSVIYECLESGFEPMPKTRTCQYDSDTRKADWDMMVPVCQDVEKPNFTNCVDGSTVKLNLYSMASSAMTEPTAVDNSGIAMVTVSPDWFSLDLQLAEGQQNVTYTAIDPAVNSRTCTVTFEVHDAATLPSLECTPYAIWRVMSESSSSEIPFSAAGYVTVPEDVTMTYSDGPTFTSSPATVGRRVIRATATDVYGFQQQCAFVLDVKPFNCMKTFLESGLKNSVLSCSESGQDKDKVVNCTVTCSDSYAFQTGETTMDYNCEGENAWTPALPVRQCVALDQAKYIFSITATYAYDSSTTFAIETCKAGLRSGLETSIPTKTISACQYVINAQTNDFDFVRFAVDTVTYGTTELKRVVVNMGLRVTSDLSLITSEDFNVCKLRMNNAQFSEFFFNVSDVNCTGEAQLHTMYTENPNVISYKETCTMGYVLKTVRGSKQCVQCEPGYYFSNDQCLECPEGQYQDQAGMTSCKDCPNGAEYSDRPALSSAQCVASCPLGFNNSESHTASPPQCKACPEDSYLSLTYTASCTACRGGTTTFGVEGAEQEDQCVDVCPAGEYPLNNTHCGPCPRGYYKGSPGNVACTPCAHNQTTNNVRSQDVADCVDLLASSVTCQNNGTATIDYHKVYCVCLTGYYGDNCEHQVDACDSNPCYNNGTCSSSGSSSFSCQCPSDDTCIMETHVMEYNSTYPSLQQLSTDLDSCKTLCLNTGDCASILFSGGYCLLYDVSQFSTGVPSNGDTFIKNCSRDYHFSGALCEVDTRDDCLDSTCFDRSFCRDLVDNADCVCPSDSKYSGPRCEIQQNICSPGPCENGTCVDSGNGVRATCDCLPGFTGEKCDVNINECKANPDGCLQRGQCVDEVNGYRCVCNGYQGDHCQIPTDYCSTAETTQCASNVCYNDYNTSVAVCVCEFPYQLNQTTGQCEEIDVCKMMDTCRHNATCSRQSPGVYSCVCPDGYDGFHCQHDVDDCSSNPCQYGDCEDRVNNYFCKCQAGYEDKNCSTNTNDCTSHNCTSGQTDRCEDLVNGFQCVCNVGFTGKYCESNINECLSFPCKHNGSCTESSTPGNYSCACQDGWIGKNCDSLPEFCTDDLCQNGGTCHSLQDDFFCSCASGTFGEKCNTTKNLCDTFDPCTSASNCVSGDGTATCECPMNYTGGSCNLIEDACSSTPCENGGTCVPQAMGYKCTCDDGYSGTNCTVSTTACTMANCPPASQCVIVDEEAICLCGAGQIRSGNVCKEISNNFDINFKRAGPALRSVQPFRLAQQNLTLMLLAAPLQDSYGPLVELILSNGTRVVSVGRENVTFGDEAAVLLRDTLGNARSFKTSYWNLFILNWDASGFDFYLNGINLAEGVSMAAIPSPEDLIFIHMGADFVGYISQLDVWQRKIYFSEALDLNSDPFNPSSQDLVVRWGSYRLYDNLNTQVITPSFADLASAKKVCGKGQMADVCSVVDKEPPVVANCPKDSYFRDVERLVQIDDIVPDDLFTNGGGIMSNIDSTVLTFGTYRLVYASMDGQNNVAFCRFNAYVIREGQSCNNTNGLDLASISDCGAQGKGKKVTCASNKVAPLSPRVLTCGKSGSYGLGKTGRLPPAIICSATQPIRFKLRINMKYRLRLQCNSPRATQINTAIVSSVSTLKDDWPLLCDNNCDNVIAAEKCDSSNEYDVLIDLTISNLPDKIFHVSSGVSMHPKELLQFAILEDNKFDISGFYNAALQSDDFTIESEKSCGPGHGLTENACVECVRGMYLNETSERCELCPVGSFTNADRLTSCTACPGGQTTLQEGSTDCVEECSSGSFYDQANSQCKLCRKNFYQNETGQVECVPCPSGTASETNGSVSLGQCFAEDDVCEPGTELKNTSCVDCPRGTYSDGVKLEQCALCPAGNTTAETKSTSITRCSQTACDAGTFRNASTNLCEECPYGYYQPEKWQDKCEQCNESYTTENTMSNSSAQCRFVCPAGEENLAGTTCSLCKEGFYRTDSMEDRFQLCTGCNSTFTTAGEGSTMPEDCKIRICNAGYKRNVTTNLCEECEEGFYQPQSLMTDCIKCPRNLTTVNTASDNASLCVFYCAAGYEVLSAENETCKACDRGYFKTNAGADKFGQCVKCTPNTVTTNDLASEDSSACNVTVCTAGQTVMGGGCSDCGLDSYQDLPLPYVETTCQKCPNGTGTLDIKSESTDCKPTCDPGEEYNSTSMACQPCAMGFWNSGNHTQRFLSCTPCRSGYVTVNEMTGATSEDNCTLRDCPAGSFIDGDNCTLCPVGTYQDTPRQTNCTDCRPKTNTSGEGQDEERDCTISCPVGEEQIPGIQEDRCQLCQPDFYKSSLGPGTCQQCTGNYTADATRAVCDVLYCDSGFEINGARTECLACQPGTFKEMRGDNTNCTGCPANTTTAGEASGSRNDCNKARCVQGFYSPDDSLPCLPCPLGFHKNTTGNENCTACQGAFTTPDVASTDPTDCTVVVCPVGRFRNSGNQCEDCPFGEFQNETGQTDCKICPPGYNTTGTGSDMENDCRIVCPVGSVRDDVTNQCEPCPVGAYQDMPGMTVCTNCSTDYTTAARGANSSSDCYVICQAGSYSTSRTTCDVCPHGTYQPNPGADMCTNCSGVNTTTLQTESTSEQQCQPICTEGQYLNTTARQCQSCSLGFYNPLSGNTTTAYTSCTQCPAGNTTSFTGSTSLSDCHILDCKPGSFRSSSVGCEPCPYGSYQPQNGQTGCIQCNQGLTTYFLGQIHNSSCYTECPDGEQYNFVDGACENCTLSYFRVALQHVRCIKCPPGQTTIGLGANSCVNFPGGGTTPTTGLQRTLYLQLSFVINDCTNKPLLRNRIKAFVTSVLLDIDIAFPSICRNRCDNLIVAFETGCLLDTGLVKRQTSSQQTVGVTLSNVGDEVASAKTNETAKSKDVVQSAFYNTQNQEPSLGSIGVTYQGVTNVNSTVNCQAGTYASGDTCEPCAVGSFSVDGQSATCPPCLENTYQNLTGQAACKPCPSKTFVSSTGSTNVSACLTKCEEPNSRQKYCSDHGNCVFESSASDGVRCECDDNYNGASCSQRQYQEDDKTLMIGGIVGGACAFLLVLLLIFGVVGCMKRSAEKGKRGRKGNSSRENGKDGMSESFIDYNYPIYDNGMRGFSTSPGFTYINPVADQDVRDFYGHDRASLSNSRYSY